MMTEIEADRIAEAIRLVALQDMYVEAVEQHPETRKFQVRCRYTGPTFKYEQQLFLHGMPLCIQNSYEWKKLFKILNRGTG